MTAEMNTFRSLRPGMPRTTRWSLALALLAGLLLGGLALRAEETKAPAAEKAAGKNVRSLSLSAQPEVGLEIYVDDVGTGLRTPQILQLSPGVHRVRLVAPWFKTEPVWQTDYADGKPTDFVLAKYGQKKAGEDIEKGSTIQYDATDILLFGKYSLKTTNTPGVKMRAQTNLSWHWLSSEPGKAWIRNDLEAKESLITVWTYVSGKPGPEPNWFSLMTTVFDAGWESNTEVTTTDVHTKDMKIREWFWVDSGKFNRQPVAEAPPYPLDKWVKVSLYTKLNGANSHVMVFQDDYLVVDAKDVPFRPANKRPDFMHWGGYASEGNGPLTVYNSRTSVERVLGPGPSFTFVRWERDGKQVAGNVSNLEIDLTAAATVCVYGEGKLAAEKAP